MDVRKLGIAGSLALSVGVAWVLASLGALGQEPPIAQSSIRYVSAANGVDVGGCTAPAQPCATVQYAVDQAAEGDEVRIAAGVYTDVHQRAGITQTVYISKTVTLRGGYDAAFAEPPDPDAHPTTLDAQGQGRVLYIIGAISPTVEGLRIIGGNAAGLGGHSWGNSDAGGGAYVSIATANLRDSQVFNNTAGYGGGLYLNESPTALGGNFIFSNTASVGGGAYLYQSPAAFNNNIVFSNTVVAYGGGAYLYRSPATFSDNTVVFNSANVGGGLFLDGSAAMFTGNTITSNSASLYGGGLCLVHSDSTLTANTVTANTAERSGGGLFLSRSAAMFSGNTITTNSADSGGGLFLYRSGVMVTNTIVAHNQARTVGNGLYIEGSSPHLWHTTVACNRGGDGSGVYVTDGRYVEHSIVALTNTILVSHTVGISVTTGNTVTLEATLWGTGAWANGTDWAGAGTIVTGTRNVWGDPAFVNAAVGDYNISPDSAARDAGVDAGVYWDIDQELRPYLLPDLGVDEYWPPGTPIRFYLPLVLRGA